MDDYVNETIAFQERVAFGCLGWNTLGFRHCIGDSSLKALSMPSKLRLLLNKKKKLVSYLNCTIQTVIFCKHFVLFLALVAIADKTFAGISLYLISLSSNDNLHVMGKSH